MRSDEYVSVAGQRELIAGQLDAHRSGTVVPFVIELEGQVVGRIMLGGITRGPFQSAVVAYWVGEHVCGRGVASAALGLTIDHAFGELNLHRLQGDTRLVSAASSHLLVKAGFEQYGVAKDYLRIGGRWQDCRLFQLLNGAWTEAQSSTR